MQESTQLETEKKEEILEMATKVFMRYGLRSVTMDDIARELKISKKTLYRFVTDKSDLVAQVMSAYIDNDRKKIDHIRETSANAIEEILLISEHVGSRVKDIHPSIHYDMEKYYADAWNIFNEHRGNFLFKCIQENMARGIKENFYRKNINIPVIALIYVNRIDLVFDGNIFPPEIANFGDVEREMVHYHLHGIVNENGTKILIEKINSAK